jgi:hypothetical protein
VYGEACDIPEGLTILTPILYGHPLMAMDCYRVGVDNRKREERRAKRDGDGEGDRREQRRARTDATQRPNG